MIPTVSARLATSAFAAFMFLVAACGSQEDLAEGYSTTSSRDGALTALPKPGKDVVLGPNDCSIGRPCPSNCNERGSCRFGQCFCDPGFEGAACENAVGCPEGCSEKGVCLHGRCYCDPGYAGAACEKPVGCPEGCSGNGVCLHGRCFCNPGFEGGVCEKPVGCPGGCSNNGQCFYGKCFCTPGYEGENCEKPVGCPGGCSNNGQCFFGKCFCVPGYAGDSCEKPVGCPSDCSNNGVCTYGKCFCNPGFAGDACEKPPVTCPNGCSGAGVCLDGTCACVAGFTGEDCSKPVGDVTWSSRVLSLESPWISADDEAPLVFVSSVGQCVVSGAVTGGEPGSAIATLPPECRPKHRLIFGASASETSTRVDVLPDGALSYQSGSTTIVTLDEIRFTLPDGEPLTETEGMTGPIEGTRSLAAVDAAGLCWLQGTTGWVASKEGTTLVVAVLPPACRPARRLVFSRTSGGGTTRVDILPDGTIHRTGTSGGGWLSLDGIVFASSKTELSPLTLEFGWVGATPEDGAEALEYQQPSYRKGGGLCVLSGLVRSSQNSTGGTVATLPADCRPVRRMVFSSVLSPGTTFEVDPASGMVQALGGGSGNWLSLDGIRFVSSK